MGTLNSASKRHMEQSGVSITDLDTNLDLQQTLHHTSSWAKHQAVHTAVANRALLTRHTNTGESTPHLTSNVCQCTAVYAYHCFGAGLDDPGVLGSDEAQAVEGSQVTVYLLLQPPLGAHLPAQTHAVLKHDRTGCERDNEWTRVMVVHVWHGLVTTVCVQVSGKPL